MNRECWHFRIFLCLLFVNIIIKRIKKNIFCHSNRSVVYAKEICNTDVNLRSIKLQILYYEWLYYHIVLLWAIHYRKSLLLVLLWARVYAFLVLLSGYLFDFLHFVRKHLIFTTYHHQNSCYFEHYAFLYVYCVDCFFCISMCCTQLYF